MRAVEAIKSLRLRDLSRVSSLFPFLSWISEIRKPAVLRADLVAGITVALILIPQSMAYAQLAGLPAYYGLYASFLPGIVAALFGSSRQLSTGPVAVVSLLTATALEPIARFSPDNYLVYAVVLALIVGGFQVSLGLLRLGALVSFVSHPVVIGFTNAAAIIIATSQIGPLLGVTVERTAHHYETVYNTVVAAISGIHLPTVMFGILSFVILLSFRRYLPRFPAVLVAVIITTVISWYMGYANMRPGAIVGDIPAGLPGFDLPSVNWSEIVRLVPVAVTIALVGFMEAISIAKTMAAQTRQRLDANQELIGQGLANLTSGSFQGSTVSGSFSRSAVNLDAGAVTGWSSIFTGALVGITLFALTPLFYHLPKATLAAVIMVAVANLVHIQPFIKTWKSHKHDGIVAVGTFLLTLILAPHLEYGIILGVIMSLMLYLYRTMQPRVLILSRHTDGTLRDADLFNLELCPNISILRFDGSLYFANTGFFEERILERVAAKPDLKFVVLDGEGINEIDATGIDALTTVNESLAKSGVELLIARAKRQLRQPLDRTGLTEEIGADRIFRIRNQAIMYAWSKIDSCQREGCTQTCPLRAHMPSTETSAGATPAVGSSRRRRRDD